MAGRTTAVSYQRLTERPVPDLIRDVFAAPAAEAPDQVRGAPDQSPAELTASTPETTSRSSRVIVSCRLTR